MVGKCLVFFLRFLIRAADTSERLDHGPEDHLGEGDHQAEDQPQVDHLHVRGGGQLLYLAREDGGHHQHDGQVYSYGIAEEVFVEEDGGVGDEEQEDGGKVGGQQLCCNLPLQFQSHEHQVPLLVQRQFGDGEHRQVLVLGTQLLKLLRLT